MVVAGWAWDDHLLALTTFGTVWRILAVWLLADVLFVWVWARALGGRR